MTALEITDIFQIPSDIFIVLLVVTFIILVAVPLLLNVRRKNQVLAAENLSSSSTRILTPEFRKHLYFLNRISQQIAEDRIDLTKSLVEETSLREKRFDALLSSVEATSQPFIHQKYFKQADEIINKLETLESDFLSLKNQLQQASPRLMSLVNRREVQPCSSVTAAVPTQTEDAGECIHELCNEVSTSDLLPILLIATKDFFSKLALENREKEKEMIKSITRCLEQSQKEIEKEINIFSSAAARDEQGIRNNAELSLIDEVDSIETKLRKTFICLNRLRFDMENMYETLTCFNKKFLYVRTKFGGCWEQGQVAYSNAVKRLGETEVLWNSSEERMGKNISSLVGQSKIFTGVASEIRDVLKLRAQDAAFSFSLKQLKVNPGPTERNLDVPCLQNIEHASEKLLAVTKETMGSMTSLVQTTKNLENFYDMVNSTSEGYITFLISILRSLEDSEMSEKKYKLGLIEEDKSTDVCSSDEVSATSEKHENWAVDKALLAEVCQDLNLDYHDVNMENITAILKDIIKATWKLIGNGSISNEDGSLTDSAETSFYTVTQDNNEWENIPTESLLSDVSSDCLIQNSDESDLDLRVGLEKEKS